MNIIDFTHTIEEGMPVYPGTEGPKLIPANSYEKNGFRETSLTFYSHTGTHMDAPAHLFPAGKTLDQFPAAHFVGKGLVIDCSELNAGESITMTHIDRQKEIADKADYLLFYTGWSRYWGTEAYFGNYPCINHEVADYLLDTKKKGIGLDTIGLDPISDEGLTLHKKLLKSNHIVIIENLTNLPQAGTGLFFFSALPLNQIHADGAPVRAIGVIDH